MDKKQILKDFMTEEGSVAPFFDYCFAPSSTQEEAGARQGVETLWQWWIADRDFPERGDYDPDLENYREAFKALREEAYRKLRRRIEDALRKSPALVAELGPALVKEGWVKGDDLLDLI